MCGQDVNFTVDIEPSLQPRLLMYRKKLDFSSFLTEFVQSGGSPTSLSVGYSGAAA